MGKITVKHYLNTNLKPYIVNGEQYYSIYALVTADRKNTKVKSNTFNEYYTANDFSEITNNENIEDYNLIKNEEAAIINIVNLVTEIFKNFDTTLFAAIFNFYQNIFLLDLYLLSDILFEPDNNKLGLNLFNFWNMEFSQNESEKGLSLFSFYSAKGQDELDKYLKNSNIAPNEIHTINKFIFHLSLEKLIWIFKGSKKYEILIDKYNTTLYRFEENALQLLKSEKYNPIKF